MATCSPQSLSPIAAPAVAASLTAFVLVYGAVFGAGFWYILHMMHKPVERNEPEPPAHPTRTAGVTPAAAMDDTGRERA